MANFKIYLTLYLNFRKKVMKTIHCPYCKMRLFDLLDAIENGKARIEIKCVRCRNVVKIELKEAGIKTTIATA